MNSFSHNLIGKILLNQLSARYGVELDRRSFLYGCMLPDFTRYFKRLPHEPLYWERYIKNEIRDLSGLKQTGKRFGPGVSKRLGVICHFYADYFCFAHTCFFEGGTLSHMKYEWHLDRRLRDNAAQLHTAELGLKPVPALSAETIYADMASLLDKYKTYEPGYMRDLTFALRACAGLIAAVAESAAVPAVKPLMTGMLAAGAANG